MRQCPADTFADHRDAAKAREKQGRRRLFIQTRIERGQREEVRVTRPRSTKSAAARADARSAEISEQWWAGLSSRERENWSERLAARGFGATPDAAMALHGVDMFWAAVRRQRERQDQLVADRTRIGKCGCRALD